MLVAKAVGQQGGIGLVAYPQTTIGDQSRCKRVIRGNNRLGIGNSHGGYSATNG
jgi:hypothetical protein